MKLNKSVKIFLLAGIIISLLGFILHDREVAEFAGIIVMISGISLVLGAIISLVLSWGDLDF